MAQQKVNPNELYYEESVIFHQWLMESKQIGYPLNESLWIKVCSFGLYSVLQGSLLEAQYQQWLRYRQSALDKLGERFVPDAQVKGNQHMKRASDEQVQVSLRHWA